MTATGSHLHRLRENRNSVGERVRTHGTTGVAQTCTSDIRVGGPAVGDGQDVVAAR